MFDESGVMDALSGDWKTPAELGHLAEGTADASGAGQQVSVGQSGRQGHRLQSWNMLSLGDHDVGLPFHNHGASWLGVVHGRKRWFLAPPAHAVFSMLPAHEWVTKRLPRLR